MVSGPSMTRAISMLGSRPEREQDHERAAQVLLRLGSERTARSLHSPDKIYHLDSYALDLIERNLVVGPIVKLGGPRRLVRRDLLCVLESAAVLHVSRNAGRPKCVAAGGVGQGGCLRSPFDHG